MEALTSGTQEAPAHVDGGGEEAVPLGAAMAAADHDVMREDDAARRHAAVPCVVGHWTPDTAHQTACVQTRREVNIMQRYSFFIPESFMGRAASLTSNSAEKNLYWLFANLSPSNR